MFAVWENKPSNVNTIVSSGILQYLFMIVLAYSLFSFADSPSTSTQQIGTGLVEFNEEAVKTEVDAILSFLGSSSLVNKRYINHLTKTDAIEFMSEDIDANLLETLARDNPFRESISFQMNNSSEIERKALKEKITSNSSVDGVYFKINPVTQSNMNTLPSDKSSLFTLFIPLIIILVIYLSSLVRRVLSSNKALIRSLALYGSEDVYLKSGLLSKLSFQVLLGWIVALLLFILSFYLIFGNLAVHFANINIRNIFIVIVLPLILSITILFVLFQMKFSNYLKHSA